MLTPRERYVHVGCPTWLADGKLVVSSSSEPFTCDMCGAHALPDDDPPSKAEAAFLAALRKPSIFGRWANIVRKSWTAPAAPVRKKP